VANEGRISLVKQPREGWGAGAVRV